MLRVLSGSRTIGILKLQASSPSIYGQPNGDPRSRPIAGQEGALTTIDLTIALERYDRHVPFFTGTVSTPEGVRLQPLEVGMEIPGRHGLNRHGRMLHEKEFDICEMSLGSYVMAKSRNAPFTATPVFPRRLFSQNHMYVHVTSNIHSPKDLVGKKVAIRAFQVTMSILAKGDLKFEFEVPWEEIHWLVQREEELPWTDREGISIDRIPDGRNVGQMLVDGEIDALIHPHPPLWMFAGNDRVRRLFPDTRGECVRYFRKYGYYPIMHVMVFNQDLVEREPWLPKATIDMWEDAKRQTNEMYTDPGYSILAFARNEVEVQEEELGPDIWPSGLSANRADLERFIGYCHDQRLIEEPFPPERLFHDSVLDT